MNSDIKNLSRDPLSLKYSWVYHSKAPSNGISGAFPYRGLQDLSAAVRYLREHHTDYGIDYNNIYIWGSSAGAFSGIHLSYMEEEDRMASTFVNNFGWDPDLGCIDCSGNDFDHDSKPKAVIACWGGIFDLDWINEGASQKNVYRIKRF